MNTNSKIKINMDALKTSKEWVRHKVKPGSNIFRILPPFGEASNGFPYRKWQVIWGLQDPETGRMRPYASSMMSDKRDPVVEFVDGLRERLTKMEGDLRARGMDDKTLAKHPKYSRLSQFIRDFSPKTVYVYNAVDKSGVVGLLELKSTAHKDMKAKMNEYIKDYNQDPTSLNSADDDSGVWFDIQREGTGFNTEYKVKKVQTKSKLPSGQAVFVDDRSPLPDVVVENFDNLAYDLTTLYKENSYDDLNEVLQANLDRLYEVCPEANTSVEVNLDEAEPVAQITKSAQPKMAPGFNKVKLQLNDEEDEVTTSKVTVSASIDDDDFMKAADDILNG